MDEESTSSSNSSDDSPETETIVITPSELERMGLAKQLKNVIEAQTQKKGETAATPSAKQADNPAELTIDAKSLQRTMKNKLCTLLNHTPLVMQVKNMDWMPSGKKSPIVLNSTSKIPPAIMEDDNEESEIRKVKNIDRMSSGKNSPIVLNSTRKTSHTLTVEEYEESETKRIKTFERIPSEKRTPIVLNSVRKSPPIVVEDNEEFETKKVRNIDRIPSEKMSPILLNSSSKTITLEEDEESETKPKLKIVSDEQLNISASEIESMINSGKLLKSNVKISSPLQKQNDDVKDDTNVLDVKPESRASQSTSKGNASDPSIIKKECLKRIQAKMYENLKKVLEEVDSRPLKDKASLSYTPVATSAEESSTLLMKSTSVAKLAGKKRENKPCYMNTYRERKVSQDSCDSTKLSPTNEEVIEIDSKPTSPAITSKTAIIDIDDDDVPKVVNTPRKRGRPPKIRTEQEAVQKSDAEKTSREIVSPLKKSIVKRFSELGNRSISPEETITVIEQKVPKRRGRPPKYPPKDLVVIDKEEAEAVANPESESEPSEQKPDVAAEKPTLRKRGRPPKKPDIESNTEVVPERSNKKEQIAKQDHLSENDLEEPTVPAVSETEVKTPRKRGRKSKVELAALKKEVVKKVEVVETPRKRTYPEYTKSKTSGRKRKMVNYSLLNGEDSDLDEPVQKYANKDRRKSKSENLNEDSDNSTDDEYGPSVSNKSSEMDQEEGEVVPKKLKVYKAEKEEDKEVAVDKIEDKKVVGKESIEEEVKEPTLDQVECAVCKENVEKSLWSEHKRKVHNDLAWISGEEPLVSVNCIF